MLQTMNIHEMFIEFCGTLDGTLEQMDIHVHFATLSLWL